MSVIVGFDQGSYTVNAGTRQITLSGLNFVPTVESLLYVLNYTQSDTYYALAEGLTNWVTITDNGDDPRTYTLEYSNLAKFPALEENDTVHIQFADQINVQNPLPTDGDSVYCKDIDVTNSDIGDFSGVICDLFDSLKTIISNTTSDNPKVLKVWFNRTIYAHDIGLGCDELTSGFGTDVTLKLLGSGEAVRATYNFTDINKNSALLQFSPSAFNGFILEFNTVSTVCISNITIRKAIEATTTLQGEDPNGIIKNVGVQVSGALRNSIEDGQTGRRCEVEPLGALKTETPVRLVGTTFSNGTKDPNFWTETVTGSGSVTQSGEIILSTGTTANSTAKYETGRKARKITGTTNQFRAVARNVQAPAADCIRRIGAYNSSDGFFFQFNGETFQVGSRKLGVDTLVSNGSFNGNAGDTIDFGEGLEFIRVVIDYTALSAKFFIDGVLVHTIMPTSASLTNSLNLPVTMEIINENGNTVNNQYEILFATILRLGELDTEAEYKFINTNTTTVCKYNAGRLKRVLNVDNAGNITIYDNTAASGTIIATIDTAKALGTLDFDVPFSSGLTVVTASGAKVVVIYE